MREAGLRLALVVVSVVLTLGLVEGLLALLHNHQVTPERVYERYDPVLGWANLPNADSEVVLNGTSRFHRRHNSRGLRGAREFPYAKPEGTSRVLLLGDSFFWGYGLEEDQVVGAVLQQLVPPRVEIINGASRGYGTDQELLWLTREGIKYQPDVVILGLFAANDWDDIARTVRYGYPKPYFRIENGHLALHNVPVPERRKGGATATERPRTVGGTISWFLRERTHLYPFVIRRLTAVRGIELMLLKRGLAFEPSPDGIGGTVERMLPEKQIQPLFEALLKETASACRNAGADFLLVFIPLKENTPGTVPRYQGVREGANRTNDAASRYLRQLSAAKGYAFLDLLPLVRDRHRRGEILYNPRADDHHWTPAGSRMAAEAMAARLAGRAAARGETSR